ncbi:MAG: SDR family oxidoreductase [Bacillota bacterium]
MRRELIIGASGLVGSYLYRHAQQSGAEVYGTYCTHPAPGLLHLDMTDRAALARSLEQTAPDVIYLPAANPNVEWVEEHPEAAYQVNVAAVLGLCDLLQGARVKLVYYSSDYVFDGRSGPYTETDRPNPVSEYGRQKLAVEEAIQARLRDWLILRVTVVYGWEARSKNFAHRTVSQLRNGQPLRVPVDQYGNPTYAPNLAEASRELVAAGATGLFHLAGETRQHRFDFAREVARVFDLPAELLIPVTTDQLQQKARRPLEAGMVVSKAAALLKTPLLGSTAGLLRMKDEERRFLHG